MFLVEITSPTNNTFFKTKMGLKSRRGKCLLLPLASQGSAFKRSEQNLKTCQSIFCGLGQHFQERGHSFFELYGPTLSRQITFFPTVNWPTSGFLYATFSLNWIACRLQTIVKNPTSERASNSDTGQRKMNFVMLINNQPRSLQGLRANSP